MESKELELLEIIADRLIKFEDKMTAEMREVKERLSGVEGKMTGVESRLTDIEEKMINVGTEVRNTNLRIENDVWPAISILKDGHHLVMGKLNNLEKKTDDIEETVEVLNLLQNLKAVKK